MLRLARKDLYNTKCTKQHVSTTFDSSVFTLAGNLHIVSLFFLCNVSLIPMVKANVFFSCNLITGLMDSFYVYGPLPTDPTLPPPPCKAKVSLPVLDNNFQRLRLDRSFLVQSLNEGFDVTYQIPFGDNCTRCSRSGGICGFDGKFICNCGNKGCSGNNFSKAQLITWMVIGGATVIATGLMCGALIIFRRNEKRKATSQYFSSKVEDDKGNKYFGAQKFSYAELEDATNHFDASKELGDGRFGRVYHGLLGDGRVVAVKRLYETNVRRAEQFINEVEILTRLRHKNLVSLYGFCTSNSKDLLLVYEFIPNGTLADHLYRRNYKASNILAWSIRLSIALETADALAYLHASDIIHRDVKTNNILLDNDFRVKVADFGLSRFLPIDATHVSTNPQGTLGYLDPEYNQYYQLTDMSDVYSFGVILIQLISSLPAVDFCRKKSEIMLTNLAICRIQNRTLNDLVDPKLKFEQDDDVKMTITLVAELAFRCLQEEKEMRPTMREVLEILKTIQKRNDQFKNENKIIDHNGDSVLVEYVTTPGLSEYSNSTPPTSSVTDKWVTKSTTSCFSFS